MGWGLMEYTECIELVGGPGGKIPGPLRNCKFPPTETGLCTRHQNAVSYRKQPKSYSRLYAEAMTKIHNDRKGITP